LAVAFGDNNQFGARVNLVHREGEGAVDNDKRRTTLASLGLDYRGDRFRSSLDFGYQKKRSTAVRWASISAAWISFLRCRITAKTTARSGAIAISKANSAWRRQNMT
jgi:hypothetical protein